MSDPGATLPAGLLSSTAVVPCVELRTTVDDIDVATRMARMVIEVRAAACAHVSSPITSWYWWEDEMQCTVEFEVTVRTAPGAADRAAELMLSMHPYGVPALVVTTTSVSATYGTWMNDNVESN